LRVQFNSIQTTLFIPTGQFSFSRHDLAYQQDKKTMLNQAFRNTLNDIIFQGSTVPRAIERIPNQKHGQDNS